MRKYIYIFVLFALILSGFSYNSSIASAYDLGCSSAGPFSTITGMPCNGYSSNSTIATNQQYYMGQRGNDVLALQQMLESSGFLVGRIDGIYGPKTERAYLRYQNKYPINVPTCNTLMYPNYCPTQTQPTISGVSGPQSVNVNQNSTWTVTAYDQSGSNLTYSVNWGDQYVYPFALSAAPTYLTTQQNATFTHTYAQAGTYNPVFTVTNSTGQTAQTSLSVSVGNGIGNVQAPTISYLSPNSGAVGTSVTIYGTGFNSSCNIYSVCPTKPASSANTINFGNAVIPFVYANNGTSITFTVPSSNTCGLGQMCTQVIPGTYQVSVNNSNGVSNSVNFTVTGNPVPSPVIYSFYAVPLTINSGQSTTLTWSSQNTNYCSIDYPGNPSGVYQLNGSGQFSPNQTTTYTLTCSNSLGQTDTKTVTVNVR